MQKQTVSRASMLVLAFVILITCTVFSDPVFANVRIWAAGSTEKIQRDNRSEFPHDRVWNESTKTVSIAGVRGEHVPFQIIVTADHVNVFGIKLKKSALRSGSNVLPGENIRLYYEHIIKVYTPSGIHGKKGYWPDALAPITRPFNIQSGGRGRPPQLRNQPIWVDIVVPRDQSPGTYKGKITVSSNEGKLGEVNVELTVWNVTMPAERHYPALMRIGPREVSRVHGLDEDSHEFM